MYLPWFTLADKDSATRITVRHLVNQTSGISEKDGNRFWNTDATMEEAAGQMSAIAVGTDYFQTAVAENEAFENNLAEVRSAHVSLGEMPLIVISRGYWDDLPGFSDAENQQAWRIWQELQAELPSLSSTGRQVIAADSEHNIQLQQPALVSDVILQVVTEIRDGK